MKCPACSHGNIEGVDQCARCQADLTDVADSPTTPDIEHDLLNRPLATLIADDYLEVSPEVPVGEVVTRLNVGGCHCAIVVERGATVGIFTARDILNELADSFAPRAHMPVGEFMTPDPETLDHDVPIAFGLNRMMVGGYGHIPILRAGRLAGVVSVRNVLSFLVERLGETLQADAPA